MLAEQGDTGHDHARRAVAALHGPGFQERFLQWVQLPVPFQSFDGDDLLACAIANRGSAGSRGFAIDRYRASTTAAFAAPVLGAAEVQIVPQHAEESARRVGLNAVL